MKDYSKYILAITEEFTIGRLYDEYQLDLPVLALTRAWFEHTELGEDGGCGGLWFEDGHLIDYDGVFELPIEIVRALETLGFDCTEQRKYGYDEDMREEL